MNYMEYTQNPNKKTKVFFEQDFYRGEFRCDFFVSGEMKKAWAEEIEVLAEIDRICKLHDITYFADSGTLLGAVRHKGFIPWDDDIDIVMKRDQYDRFIAVCKEELEPEYSLLIPNERDDYDKSYIRVVNDRGFSLHDDLEWCHGCKYYAGVDIFPYDNCIDDVLRLEEQKLHSVMIEQLRLQIIMKQTEQIEESLQQLEKIFSIRFDRKKDLKKQLGDLFEQVCTQYNDKVWKKLTLFPYVAECADYIFEDKWYQNTVLLDFEGVKIPCPANYEQILEKMYGNYMEFVRGAASHDYPYYLPQIEYKKIVETVKLRHQAKRVLCTLLNMKKDEIQNIEILKAEGNNQTLKFQCYGDEFVFRIPRKASNKLVDYHREHKIYEFLQREELTDVLYFFSPENGYKITGFICDNHICDPKNWREVADCMQVLKYVHTCEFDGIEESFGLLERIEYYQKLWEDASYFSDYEETKKRILEMNQYVSNREKAWGLTHFDPAPANFLIFDNRGNTDIRMIDWEYAAMQDTHIDIALFALNAKYSRQELDQLIRLYFGEEYRKEISLKIYCYMAMGALYYSNYYEYLDRNGVEMNQETLKFYQIAKEYYMIWEKEK